MSDNNTQERRQFSRVEFDATVSLVQEGRSIEAKLVDISLNGMLIETPKDYQLRTDMPCSAVVHLSAEVAISMQVSLVHSSSTLLGFHCTSIDMDSITHLRRLIEMNLEDDSASERVLSELLKRHQQSA